MAKINVLVEKITTASASVEIDVPDEIFDIESKSAMRRKLNKFKEEYFKTHERIPAAPLSKPALVKKSFAVLLAIVILTLLVWLVGARTFTEGFVISYLLWQIGNWYDCFFLDWVLFANIKKIRLPGTEHMDKAYHQKMYHFVHAIVGMAVGLIPCLLTGLAIHILM